MTTNELELVVMFGERRRFYAFLRELDRGVPVVKTMLRARLTRNGGWMKLLLQGPPDRLDEIVRDGGDAIASFTRRSSKTAS